MGDYLAELSKNHWVGSAKAIGKKFKD